MMIVVVILLVKSYHLFDLFYPSNKMIEYLFGNILSSFGPHYMMIIIQVSIFASFSSEMSKIAC